MKRCRIKAVVVRFDMTISGVFSSFARCGKFGENSAFWTDVCAVNRMNRRAQWIEIEWIEVQYMKFYWCAAYIIEHSWYLGLPFFEIYVTRMPYCSAPQDLHLLWSWQRKCSWNVSYHWSSCLLRHLWEGAVEEWVSFHSTFERNKSLSGGKAGSADIIFALDVKNEMWYVGSVRFLFLCEQHVKVFHRYLERKYSHSIRHTKSLFCGNKI